MTQYVVRVREEHIVDYYIEADSEAQARDLAETVQDGDTVDEWVNSIESVKENK